MHRLTKEPLRVAIGAPGEPQASFWRIWVTRSEVYLSAATIGGLFKVSLHSGGQCNAAFTSEQVQRSGGEAMFPDGSRRVVTWRRGLNGVVIALQLEVPSAELRAGAAGRQPSKNHIWLAAPGPGGSRSLLVAFGCPKTVATGWPQPVAGAEPLAADELPNGEGLAVLTVLHQTSTEVIAAIAEKRGRLGGPMGFAAGVAIDRRAPTSRLIVTGQGSDGRRIFVEAALRCPVAA